MAILYIPRSKPQAKVRLICFPYAGGNSSTYAQWETNLSSEIELVLTQFPGRGTRFSEPPITSMDELVREIYADMMRLSPKPFIFYGHSMGARVAYELTLMLHRNRRVLPVRVIVSGSSAPCVERKKAMSYHLPDNEFIENLRKLNGTNEELLENKELMELLLPSLRADFKIVETYCNPSMQKLPTQISVFSGSDDDIAIEDIEPWLALFESNTGIQWFDGGHFFIDEHNRTVLSAVNNVIGSDFCKVT